MYSTDTISTCSFRFFNAMTKLTFRPNEEASLERSFMGDVEQEDRGDDLQLPAAVWAVCQRNVNFGGCRATPASGRPEPAIAECLVMA